MAEPHQTHPTSDTPASPPSAVELIDPQLLQGISIYQDVVLNGRTVLQGVRDCPLRWEIIRPHLPPGLTTLLDVGSNFGWFGLQVCKTFPQSVVVSVEADPRSARVQRAVLQSHRHERIVLLTSRANLALLQKFTKAESRFDAALVFSVLHWIGDHERFMHALGRMTGRLFIEHPDPREEGSGDERLRREIGPIGEYLRRLFPDRPVQCLGKIPSHRSTEMLREMWMVGEPAKEPSHPAPSGLALLPLLENDVAWPPRSWWLEQLNRAEQDHLSNGHAFLTHQGIIVRQTTFVSDVARQTSLAHELKRCRKLIAGLPENDIDTLPRRCRRTCRQIAGAAYRGIRGWFR